MFSSDKEFLREIIQNDPRIFLELMQVDKILSYDEIQFQGLCPLHNDRSPSFGFNSEKFIFNCFGCGECGDAFTLVMKVYKLNSFKEVLEELRNIYKEY